MPTSFGHIVKRHRIAAGMTQGDVATACDLSIAYVSALERRITHPPRGPALIAKLADCTGASADELFKAAGVRPPWKARPTGREIDRIVGRNIRTRRIAVGLRQYQVADEIGTSRQNFSKYESGQSRISPGRLIEISEALGVEPAELLKGARDE